ncbi:MAG: hypothetical protein K6T16_03250 [Candidatus Pacearchaeota archaeon]|nr:hypothetical protein [Candidatus Pacearchaeota archaeon]
MFRDKKKVEEVNEYYRIAPRIVEAINSRKTRKIWGMVYQDIVKAVEYIKNKDFDGAYEHYKQTVLRLKKTFL